MLTVVVSGIFRALSLMNKVKVNAVKITRNQYVFRPDEVARVLEKAGFTMDVVTQKRTAIAAAIIMFMNREGAWGEQR